MANPAFKPFREMMKKNFAFYGFTACPLTNTELDMIREEFGDNQAVAYSVGADVAAGFLFEAACDYHRPAGKRIFG